MQSSKLLLHQWLPSIPPPFKFKQPQLHHLSPHPLHLSHVSSSINNIASSTLSAGTPDKAVLVNGTQPPHDLPDELSAQLPNGLQRELMPAHVAIIMDGNRRWARERGVSVGFGYEAGFIALRRTVELCCKWGIRALTVFAFSTENWFRPKVETDLLMGLFERMLRDELQHFVSDNIRISFIGDSTKLPERLRVLLDEAERTTENNSSLHLIVAINYSGQSDVAQACRNIAFKVKDGLIEPEEINESLIESELETSCTDFPSPDLLIRTSGELRISNFMLWQMAYTEMHFSDSLWPDFREDEFVKALCSFQQRQRRYGGRNS